MTKLITSLDQLEPGMEVTHGSTKIKISHKPLVVRHGIWRLRYSTCEGSWGCEHKKVADPVERLFLNQEVEVPE